MDIHDELSTFLGNRRTFLDDADPLILKIPEVERIHADADGEHRPFDATVPHNTQAEDVLRNPIPALSSFDILVYAYLKEALTNSRESREVEHLKSKKNLMWFVEYINLIMSDDGNLL